TGAGAFVDRLTGAGALAAFLTGAGAFVDRLTGAGALAAFLTGAGAFVDRLTGAGALVAFLTGAGAFSTRRTGAGAFSTRRTGAGAFSTRRTGAGAVVERFGAGATASPPRPRTLSVSALLPLPLARTAAEVDVVHAAPQSVVAEAEPGSSTMLASSPAASAPPRTDRAGVVMVAPVPGDLRDKRPPVDEIDGSCRSRQRRVRREPQRRKPDIHAH
ncbi:MAG: hypothetical protein AVDCRST_MAG16-1207, partial [uncultured Frankineae bacterium]